MHIKHQRYKLFRWKKGVGTELVTVAIALLSLLIFGGIIVISGRYEASLESQIISDVINDGAVAYAQNDMNVSEKAYLAMAKTIYEANSELMENSGWCKLNSYSTPTLELASEHQELFSDAEWTVVGPKNRGEIMSGTLSTNSYDFFRTSRFDDEEELQETNDVATYSVAFKGPKYMDQIASISVSSTFKIPIMNNILDITSRSVIFTTANDPYNSRADKNVNNGAIYAELVELEDVAYSSVGLTTQEIKENNNVPEYASVQQNIILEARRHLGSGYSIPATEPAWPSIDWLGTEDAPYTQGKNNYFNCYAFVNKCLVKYGGYQYAVSHLKHKTLTRSVVYRNVVSAKEIWEAMQDTYEVVESRVTSKPKVNAGSGWLENLKNQADSGNSKYEKYGQYTSWVRSGDYIYYITWDNDIKYYESSVYDPEGIMTVENGQIVKSVQGMTFQEAVAKYCGADKENLFVVDETATETWDAKAKLKAGDILTFSDPNWRPRIYAMLKILSGMEEPDEAVFSAYDSVNQAFISHVAIYIGNGRMVHAANKTTPDSDPFHQGVFVADLNGVEISSGHTQMLTGVLRFTKSGNLDEVSIIDPDTAY